MAFIVKSKALKNIFRVYKNQVKCVSYSYPDWKPGPYPKTKEEREAAAKKYGLLPEEYEPYPDDGCGHGDYPNLPLVSDDQKDQNLPWHVNDTMQVRNWGEPLHAHCVAYTMDKASAEPPEMSIWKAIWGIFGKVFLPVAILLYFPPMMYKPVAPKQLPHQGQTHYTFELVE